MLVTPVSATALANELELSSIFQPVMSTATEPVFVSSNQSAPYGALPLAHGATSETMIDGVAAPAGVAGNNPTTGAIATAAAAR